MKSASTLAEICWFVVLKFANVCWTFVYGVLSRDNRVNIRFCAHILLTLSGQPIQDASEASHLCQDPWFRDVLCVFCICICHKYTRQIGAVGENQMAVFETERTGCVLMGD